MKKVYEAPVVMSERVFETLASGCTLLTTADSFCDPDQNPTGHLLNSY